VSSQWHAKRCMLRCIQQALAEVRSVFWCKLWLVGRCSFVEDGNANDCRPTPHVQMLLRPIIRCWQSLLPPRLLVVNRWEICSRPERLGQFADCHAATETSINVPSLSPRASMEVCIESHLFTLQHRPTGHRFSIDFTPHQGWCSCFRTDGGQIDVPQQSV
jgi:hypothetical protein